MIFANANQTSQVTAAATAGNISAGTDAVFLNVVVAIKAFNLQVSEAYSLEVNGVATDNWTQSSTITSKFFYKTFASSQVSNGQINISLFDGVVNRIDSVILESLGIDTFVNTNFIQELFPVLMLLGVMLLVISAILAGVVIRRRT